VLWQDLHHAGGRVNQVGAIVANDNRVYAVGAVDKSSFGKTHFIVRAYDARTGALVWEDQQGDAGSFGYAAGIAAAGNRIFVSGESIGAGERHLVLRAYDAQSGAVLWAALRDSVTFRQLTAHGGRVFGAGAIFEDGFGDSFLVQAYDADTGALVWEDRHDEAGFSGDEAFAITTVGSRVFAVGAAVHNDHSEDADLFVRAYDARTGSVLWEDRHDVAGGEDVAFAVVAHGGQVFVAGQVTTAAGSTDFFVRGYDLRTGSLAWEDQVDGGGLAVSLDASAGRLFAAGGVLDGETFDFAVRAYDAR
jgi:outer membrane protein assembly factor BamB